MILATMRFGGYEWEHNPLSLRIEHRRNVSHCILPQSCERILDLGLGCNVISGKGELIGSDCIKKYEQLKKLFQSGKKGVLSVPGVSPIYACFTKLSAEGETAPDLITYTFEFTQTDSDNDSEKRREVYICNEGETLYDIAHECKIPLDKLVALNPQIRRPDELCDKEQVRLC